jgi:archaellum component FlaC
MARLQKEVYNEYTEIEETTMEIVNGEIITIREQWEIAKNNEFQTLSEQISDLKAGLALAKKQAKKQALAAVEKRTLDTARNLKAIKVSADKIAAATGLTPEEIRKL